MYLLKKKKRKKCSRTRLFFQGKVMICCMLYVACSSGSREIYSCMLDMACSTGSAVRILLMEALPSFAGLVYPFPVEIIHMVQQLRNSWVPSLPLGSEHRMCMRLNASCSSLCDPSGGGVSAILSALVLAESSLSRSSPCCLCWDLLRYPSSQELESEGPAI